MERVFKTHFPDFRLGTSGLTKSPNLHIRSYFFEKFAHKNALPNIVGYIYRLILLLDFGCVYYFYIHF